MTQYTDKVEYVKRKQFVEEWAAKCDYMLAQNGYIERSFNSGLITRSYADGRTETIQESMDFASLMRSAPIK